MTEPAVGVHEHPTLKLGLRPADPSRPVLRAAQFLTGRIPAHPAHLDYLARDGLTFGMYRNDEFGVCGPASAANLRRLVTAWLTGKMHDPTQDDVFDLYRRSGSPDFDPETGVGDRGVNMADMLSAVAHWGLGGVKALAYAKVDTRDRDEMRAAVAIFGGLLLGLDLQTAQQAQTDTGVWDWVPSGQWGGHAVLAGSYDDEPGTVRDRVGVITWARTVEATDAFLAHQDGEAWVVVWPEHLTSPGFLEGVDHAALAGAYTALTGRPFPAVAPAPPAPPPRPEPGPAPAPGEALVLAAKQLASDPVVTAWLARHHVGASREVADRVKAVIVALACPPIKCSRGDRRL
jgi:hypothetical protein